MLFCPQIILSEDQVPGLNLMSATVPYQISSFPQTCFAKPPSSALNFLSQYIILVAILMKISGCALKCMKGFRWRPRWFLLFDVLECMLRNVVWLIDLLPDLDNVSHLGDCHICICVCICICVWYLCVYLCIYTNIHTYTYMYWYSISFLI